jgi:hypothetical protein
MPVKKIKFIQNEHSPRCDFITYKNKPDVTASIMEYLFADETPWDIIELNNIPDDSLNLGAIIETARKLGKNLGIKEGLPSPFIVVDTEWDEFYSKKSKRFRKNLRTKRNRLENYGSCSVSEITHFDDSFKDIESISEHSWKAGIKEAINSSEQTKSFFVNLSKMAQSKGWLSIWLLKINDKPSAYEYHLHYKNKAYALKADYLESISSISPGSILDQHIMEAAFKSKLSEYDLGGSNDFYKMNWTDKIRNHTIVLVFSNSFYGKLAYFLECKVINSIKKIINPFRRKLHVI